MLSQAAHRLATTDTFGPGVEVAREQFGTPPKRQVLTIPKPLFEHLGRAQPFFFLRRFGAIMNARLIEPRKAGMSSEPAAVDSGEGSEQILNIEVRIRALAPGRETRGRITKLP